MGEGAEVVEQAADAADGFAVGVGLGGGGVGSLGGDDMACRCWSAYVSGVSGYGERGRAYGGWTAAGCGGGRVIRWAGLFGAMAGWTTSTGWGCSYGVAASSGLVTNDGAGSPMAGGALKAATTVRERR